MSTRTCLHTRPRARTDRSGRGDEVRGQALDALNSVDNIGRLRRHHDSRLSVPRHVCRHLCAREYGHVHRKAPSAVRKSVESSRRGVHYEYRPYLQSGLGVGEAGVEPIWRRCLYAAWTTSGGFVAITIPVL